MIQFLEDREIALKDEVESGQWDMFRLLVDQTVLEDFREFVARPRTQQVFCYTSFMRNKAEQGKPGLYLVGFRNAPAEAVLFKLSFQCEHLERGILPDEFQFDLQIDPKTPIQKLWVDPFKAQGLY